MNVFSLNADEIVRTAIGIERNASEFYRRASRVTDGSGRVRGIFLTLSFMEAEHATLFANLLKNLSQTEREARPYDPGNEMLFYLEGMAGLHGWEGKIGPNVKLTGKESDEQALVIAVSAEKETVFFYGFLMDFVPRSNGRDLVDHILKEEMRHVAILNHELAKVRDGHAEYPDAYIGMGI